MTDDARGGTGGRAVKVVVVGALASYALIQSVTVPTLPLIQRSLETDQATANWVLIAFFLTASVATPVLGRVGDSFGRRRVFVASLAMIGVGAVVASLAPTIEVMIAGRALQGIGGGAIPLSFALLRDHLPPERVPGAVGFASSLIPLGYAAGIVVAGPLTSLVGLSGLFLLPAAVAAAAAIAALLLVKDASEPDRRPVPVVPGLLLAGWLVALLLAISWAPDRGWLDRRVLGLGALAVLLGGAWVVRELAARAPLVDLRILSRRGLWSVQLVALVSGGVMTGLYGFLPQFAQTPTSTGYGFGASATDAGRMLLPITVTSFLGGLLSARIQRRVGVRTAIVGGACLAAVAIGALVPVHGSVAVVCVLAAVSGLGAGVYFAAVSAAAVQVAPPEHTGLAAGMAANVRTIGGTIGAAVLTTVVTAHPGPAGHPAELGYERGFAFLALLCAGVAAVALAVPGRGRGR